MSASSASDPPAGESALLAAYAAGDPAAARTLVARLTPRIHAVALRMLGDRAEAEDVTQETMLRLWKAAPTWRDTGASPGTWAYRVAANLCTDRLRRRRERPLEPREDPPEARPGREAELQGAARRRALEDALGRLPERQRLAVVLRHLEGCGNPEIAAILGITVEAVESLTARGKRALSRDLASQREALGLIDDT